MEWFAGWSQVGQHVGRLIVDPGYVVKFASLEVRSELLHEETVGRHVCILGVPVPRGLLHYQVRVVEAQDALHT